MQEYEKLQNQCYLTLMSKKDDYAYEAWLYGADNYLINPLTETGLKLF